MFGLGGQEVLIIVILVVILLFGATRLPKLGRSVGQSIRGFKKGLTDDVPDDEDDAAKSSKRDAKAANKDDAES